ncbi:SwmB domain-containing protein [Comamonas endophytica]|uniref:BapA/Bap/LapF family prefix-like domain-containing protein n=1 Tax=Comamonas endophytica TaxID=2949090 RepID=UPI003608E4A3
MNFLAKTAPIDQSVVSAPSIEVSTGLTLTEPSRVFLNVSTADIGNFSRVGNDLVFSFCGDAVTIAGFFLPEAPSELFLRGADGEAVLVLLESIGADGEIIARFLPQAEAAPFESLTSSVACVIAPESGSSLASIGAAAAAVLGGVAVLGAAANSGGGGGMDPGTPAPAPRAPSFVGATLGADGRVLSLSYDTALDAANPPPAESFAVLVNGAAVPVTAVSVVGGGWTSRWPRRCPRAPRSASATAIQRQAMTPAPSRTARAPMPRACRRPAWPMTCPPPRRRCSCRRRPVPMAPRWCWSTTSRSMLPTRRCPAASCST